MDLKNYIRTVNNFPKEGVAFKDISTLIAEPRAFQFVIDSIIESHDFSQIDKIVGFDARGFIFGSALAIKVKKPFVMVRKKSKLPGKVISKDYGLEYGKDTIEIQVDSINKGEKVMLIDDLLATGGTVKAGIELVEELGGIVEVIQFIIILKDLGGVDKINNYNFHSLLFY